MTKVNASLARQILEEGLDALQGDDRDYREAMQGPLGRSVQLHRELDTGLAEEPIHTSESSITLLEWWLESIGAMEAETAESWVEPPTPARELRITDDGEIATNR
ncbi:MAG: hypothetical protein ABR529_14540 [Actinomycetota bacterium]